VQDGRHPEPKTEWTREEEPRVELRKLAALIGPALRLVWRASPRETLFVLGLQVLAGLVLPAQVLAAKWALDSVLEASGDAAGLREVLPAIGVALAAMTAGQLMAAAARQRQRLLPELVAQTAQEMLAQKAVGLDLKALETPAFHDRLVRAQREAMHRPASMVQDMGRIVSSAVAVVGLAVLLFAVHPLLILLLTVAIVPLWWASISGGRAFYRYSVRNTPKRREIGYLQGILTMLDSAKETRVFSLGSYLLQKQRRLFDEQTEELRDVIRKRLQRDVLATLASSVVSTGGLMLILWLHFSERISLAETATAAGALLLMLPRMNNLITGVGRLHENALFVEDFWSFLAVAPAQTPVAPSNGALPDLSRLTVQGLTFSYPDTPRPALRDVSMEVGLGETVALVGENGAGKTTLAKLLCRLYDPESGVIKWNERDLRSCDPEELRARIAVIFQDFVRYQLSARENVGFGDIKAIDDQIAIGEAARRAGADAFLQPLPEGYDTVLGRLFQGGHELSSGQWQRVALARAFFRDAPLVIMDEPTGALDARAEYDLFQTMRTLFRDRAVLLISHRFSSVRMADRIYVLDDGEVVQSGAHDELIAAGGLYAELYGLQAANYSSTS
jgi:ATP-binding cassette, subfamily B, bacterial